MGNRKEEMEQNMKKQGVRSKNAKKDLERLLILLTLITSVLIGCTHNPVGPGSYKDPTKFTWTVDTLEDNGNFQCDMSRIWGSSANNLYVVGHDAGGYISGSFHPMWHYDGTKWTQVASVGGSIATNQFFELNSIYGFSANNIWAVGDYQYKVDDSARYTPLIIHWNGSQWQVNPVPNQPPNIGPFSGFLQEVGGSSPSDVWATGANVVYHFDGSAWQNVQVPLYPQGMQFSSVVGIDNNDAYMMGARNDVVQPADTTAYFLYHFDGNSWSIIDSVVLTVNNFVEKFGGDLFYMKGNLYTTGNSVFLMQGGSWIQVLDDEWVYNLGGNDINNLYAVGGMATAYYSNGKGWERLSLPVNQDVLFTAAWSDGNQTFIVGSDNRETYIVHGK